MGNTVVLPMKCVIPLERQVVGGGDKCQALLSLPPGLWKL